MRLTDLNFDILDQIAQLVEHDALSGSDRRYFPSLALTCRSLYELMLPRLVSDVHLCEAVAVRQYLTVIINNHYERCVVKLRIELFRPEPDAFSFDMELEDIATRLPLVLKHATELQEFQLHAPRILSFRDSGIMDCLRSCIKLKNIALDVNLGYGSRALNLLANILEHLSQLRISRLDLNAFGFTLDIGIIELSASSLQRLGIRGATLSLPENVRFPAVKELSLEECICPFSRLAVHFPNLQSLEVKSKLPQIQDPVQPFGSLQRLSCPASCAAYFTPQGHGLDVLDLSKERLSTLNTQKFRSACLTASPALVSMKVRGGIMILPAGPPLFANICALDLHLESHQGIGATQVSGALVR